MIITIDGPTASGKSTLACMLVQKLSSKRISIYYLNTGLVYRALSYILINIFNYSLEKINTPSLEHIEKVLVDLSYRYCAGQIFITYKNNNIAIAELKTAYIDQVSSIIGTIQGVRDALLLWQRSFAMDHDLVADGRDCGTVVFPQAEYKFFITASLEERARRWQLDELSRGKNYVFEESKRQVAMRDERDMHRSIAPLVVPENAYIIDTTHMTLLEALDILIEKIQ
jgi:CMP/dCMP kinase